MSIYDEYGFPSGSMGAINGSGETTFIDNHHLYYFGNIDTSETTNTIILKHRLSSALLMDPHTGSAKQAELKTSEDGLTEISIQLYPNQSVFLVDDGLVNQNGI